MRRRLGSLVLSAVLAVSAAPLAACADGEPDPTVAGSPAEAGSSGGADHGGDQGDQGDQGGEVALVRGTAVDGTVGDEAVPVADETAREEFLRQFAPEFAGQLRTRIEQLTAGEGRSQAEDEEPGVLAQVVAVGCSSPTSATLRGDRFEVVLPKTDVQCLAPVTTVALATG